MAAQSRTHRIGIGAGQIFISNIFQATIEEVTKGDKIGENWLPAWSPDGSRIAFTSTRDGNPEIYVANRDGSNVKRLTNNPAIDISPTWSPSGTQIAFTSNRTGAIQIYVISADGIGTAQRVTTEAYCDRATWSPAPYNELAYASQNGPGFDIHLMDLATRHVTALTFGEGTNESPAFSPNGRHIAFVSTRAGKAQIFTVSRDGKFVRQITKTGNNEMPDWSKLPETRPWNRFRRIILQLAGVSAGRSWPPRATRVCPRSPARCRRLRRRIRPAAPGPPAPAERRLLCAGAGGRSRRAGARGRKIASASIDDLNRSSPLKPVFFELDGSDVSAAGQKVLDEDAALLKRYPSWAVTIEGHCDERGTAEYNLALGERRAVNARAYLHLARHFRRPAAHRQLRQGISVRSGS